MPNWGTTTVDGNWGGSTTAVFKDTKYPAQAAQFAEWLNTNSGSIANMISTGGLYPASLAGQKLPAANTPVAFYGGQNIWQVFSQGSKAVNTSFLWGPVMSTTFTQLNDAFAKATTGSGTLADAVNTTQSSTISTMKQQGFTVAAG
jgi:multiple sugar transport system substrate-binding protein